RVELRKGENAGTLEAEAAGHLPRRHTGGGRKTVTGSEHMAEVRVQAKGMEDSLAAEAQLVGRLRWDTLAYGVALSVDRLVGLLLLPILTGAWNQESFAAWCQIIVTMGFLSNVLLVGFYHSIVRYIPGAERDLVSKVFHGMLAIVLANCALFLVVVTLNSRNLSTVLFASAQ